MWHIKCENLLVFPTGTERLDFYFCKKKQKILVSAAQCAACQKCQRCVQDKALCSECADNFDYAMIPRKSYFQLYRPVCPSGYLDCVTDPAYIKFHYPDWYAELYGDISPEEAIYKENGCWDSFKKDPEMNYYCYDDEDK